jgi:hypothetical protein
MQITNSKSLVTQIVKESPFTAQPYYVTRQILRLQDQQKHRTSLNNPERLEVCGNRCHLVYISITTAMNYCVVTE